MEKSDFVRVAGAAKPFGEYESKSGGFRRRSGPAVGWLGGGGCVVVVCCPRRYCRVVSSPSHSTIGSVSTVLKQVSFVGRREIAGKFEIVSSEFSVGIVVSDDARFGLLGLWW